MSNWIPKPAPRPKRAPKKVAPRLKRSRIKQRNAKRGGASFPKARDKAYCRWAVSTGCTFSGRFLWRQISPNDTRLSVGYWVHHCWGAIDPAHVGEHRAQGAPDRGSVLPMCRALHQFYDEHRPAFYRAVRITEHRLVGAAQYLASQFPESGGGA